MSKGLRSFLAYLAAYLDESPQRRAALVDYYRKQTGEELHRGNLSRYLAMKNEPRGDALIVFMLYLRAAGELRGGGKGEPLFIYTRPELVK